MENNGSFRSDIAERQIAELRAERDFEQSSRLTSEAQLGTRIGNLERELAESRADKARLSEAALEVRAVIEELKFALFTNSMAIKDRADQSARLFLERAALSGSGAGVWHLVPVELTREMWAAMADTLYRYKNRHHDKVAGDLWEAALAAAPTATGGR